MILFKLFFYEICSFNTLYNSPWIYIETDDFLRIKICTLLKTSIYYILYYAFQNI